MKSEDGSIRLRGQRSISSTFLSHRYSISQGDGEMKVPKTIANVSLSDFLNRKLHRSGVLPSSSKGKEIRISPLVAYGDVRESTYVNEKPEERDEADKFPFEFVLEQFKCSSNAKENNFSLSTNEEVGRSNVNHMHESRKRKNSTSLIVIGDVPEPPHLNSKQKKREHSVILSKKPRHLFNHYGNGGGWWDGNMEGVDEEEVGSRDIWEGVGSVTLGGLEWH